MDKKAPALCGGFLFSSAEPSSQMRLYMAYLHLFEVVKLRCVFDEAKKAMVNKQKPFWDN